MELKDDAKALLSSWLTVRLIGEGASKDARAFLGLGDIKTCRSFSSEKLAIEFANERAGALETWVVYKPQHVYTGVILTQVSGVNLDKVVWPASTAPAERSERPSHDQEGV
jgi:hypothetical protein